MREILFRGKRLDNGKWYFGSYLFLHVPMSDWTGRHRGPAKDVHYIVDQGDINYAVDPDTVGQYTGMKDKAGRRIFEGDIVRAETYHDCGQYGEKRWATYAVKWDEKRAMFYPFNIVDGDYLRLETFEIIGNVYDNPELVGDGKS